MPEDRYVLAIDIGTTRTKGILLDQKARTVISKSITHTDLATNPGWHEQDPVKIWWSEFLEVVHQILNTTNKPSSHIECICITGMFPCFCPADENGTPLFNALLFDDNRASEYTKLMDIPQETPPEGNELLARLLWFRQNFPELQKHLKKVFTCHNFIVYRLTGRYCVDGHTAYLFGKVFNSATFSWRKEELLQAEIEESLLPEVLTPQTVAGYINLDASAETGLRTGTPVLVGTGDMFASLLGSGACKAGDVMVHYGSAGSLIRLTQNASYLLNAQGYGDDDGIQWCAGLMRSGKQLEAISKLMSGHLPTETSDNILGYLDSTINVNNQTSTSSVFLFDTGQPKNFATVTAPLASFLAIPLTATPSDLYRSILEGFGYRIRESAEKYNLISDKIRWYGAGGGIQSNVWCQIVTDIVGKVQRVCPDADSAIGGALIAGSACNLFDLEKVINQRIIHSRLYQPQRHLQSAYDMQYQKFLFVSQLLQQYRDRYS